MAASDLTREYQLQVRQIWEQFREYALEAVREELPLPGEISKAGAGRPGSGLNWATGNLRSSVRGFGNGLTQQTIAPSMPYASTYANGDSQIPTYHGYDYISAAKSRLDFYSHVL